MQNLIGRTELRRAEGNFHNGARMLTDSNKIADGILVFGDDKEPGHKILNQTLRTDADSQADNSRAGQQ